VVRGRRRVRTTAASRVLVVTQTDVLVGLAVLVGVLGTVVPLLPGTALVAVAVLVWAVLTGGTTAWVVAAVAAAVLLVGAVMKYVVPGRGLTTAGVPTATLWSGAAAAVVGFFVVPVIGLLAGFVVGVYVAEHRRVGARAAWPSTRAALRAVGIGILIELSAASLAAAVWMVGVAST
jgi:uncharacterized protein YqgC (DUF456 family)